MSLSFESIRRETGAFAAAVAAVRAAAGRPVFPSVRDADIRARARALSERQGLLAEIRRACPVDAPIPVLRRCDFRQFERCGNRTPYDAAFRARARRLDQIACAVYLGDDSRRDELQDLIWSFCETTWWWLPAHPHSAPIDLATAMTAERFAILEAVFGDVLEAEVRQRMEVEVRQRALAPFLDPATPGLGWRNGTHNWNAVCHAGLGIAAMVYEKDPDRLAATFASLFRDLPAFLDGFTPDGGCSEGPGYWRYGFGCYARLADALHTFTRGAVDLLADELSVRIVRYPLTVALAPGHDLSFADTRGGYLPVETAALINRHVVEPGLFALCARGVDGAPLARTLTDLLSYPDTVPPPPSDLFARDAVLPQLGVAKLHGADGLVLGVKAGHNAEHHNHNDVGSFLVYRDGVQFVCDPGAPVYSAATFNAHRYESVFTNSRGHSVPVIDGRLQSTGERFRGTLAVEDTGGAKSAVVEMAGAYAVPALRRLTRTLALPRDAAVVEFEDRFAFDGSAPSVEEAFLTTWSAERTDDGCVVIRADSGGGCRIEALTPGFFEVEALTEESREHPEGLLLRRIVFRPDWARSAETVVRLRFAVG